MGPPTPPDGAGRPPHAYLGEVTETAGLALRAARVLALLTVVLGLLAMHGAAHGEHAAAATHPITVVQSPDGQHGPGHLSLPATSDRSASPEPDSDGAGALTALCLTVLMSAAVLAVRSLLRHLRRRADGAWSPFLVAAVRARPDPPPPDPVRELCISRT